MEAYNFPENIQRYAEAHTTAEDEVLYRLYRETYLKTAHPQMLSGRVQGQFLAMLSQMIKPKHILEIGTFTGYSAYCLAKGLADHGKLTTIEVNEELEDMVQHFFSKAGISDKTDLIIGNALDIVPVMNREFELIFLDANKEHYPVYYDLCIDKLKIGGYMIADNVLWGGKVATKEVQDESTIKLREFNEKVQNDARIENVFLTIRDGLMLLRKINV